LPLFHQIVAIKHDFYSLIIVIFFTHIAGNLMLRVL